MSDLPTKEELTELEARARLMNTDFGPGELAVRAEIVLYLIAAAQERRWIPVSDRLPEAETEVLASTAFGERVMKGASNFRHLGVTHWMPLPKGPTNGR